MESEPQHTAGLRGRLRAHRGLVAGLVVIIAAAVGFVLVWFQPQALLFDTVVSEEFPTAHPAGDAGGQEVASEDSDAPGPEGSEGTEPGDAGETEGSPEPEDDDEPQAADAAAPIALGSGDFSSRGRYTVTGTATTYQLEDGSRVLRLEDFESTNGPDLFVYLTSADARDTDADLNADAVDLGVLTGNIGSQNYAIPDEVDLEHYDTVVIWCERFTVGFGAADLVPPG